MKPLPSLFLKSLFVIALQALVSCTLFSQSKSTAEITIHTKIYCNHCGPCEDCKPNIIKHLEDVKGVKAATMDVEKMTITVVYNPEKTTPDALRKAISMARFQADHLPADPEAYEALDGCCKK
jgi:mercuric ion binding protein